jgi:hypothetical protein
VQIAVDEGIPYSEFKQNPHTVLVATSLGGHLCWFELGGDRWFAKPVCNFLNKMAFQIDHDSDSFSPKPNASLAAEPLKRGANFDPMRRKLAITDRLSRPTSRDSVNW